MPGTYTQSLLVVEDSDEDFEAITRLIGKTSVGIDLLRCTDGDEALDLLYRKGLYRTLKEPPRPSIILLDLNLPGTEGMEVLEQIKQDEELKSIPVIILTTSSNPRDIEACYKAGCSGYIIKPIDINRLVKTIEIFTSYWLEIVILPPAKQRVQYDTTKDSSDY